MTAPATPETVVPGSGTAIEKPGIIPPTNPPSTIAEAAQLAREMIAQGKMGPTDPIPPAETPSAEPKVEEPKAEEPKVEESVVEEPAVVTEIPPESDTVVYTPPLAGREGEPFVIEVEDKQVGDHLRMLTRGYMRGEQAREAREQAESVLQEAQDLTYAVQLDPAGYVAQALETPEDLDHVFRYLATRPGVLERASDWIQEVMSDQRELERESERLEAQRIRRRDTLYNQVNEKRAVDQNARAVTRAIGKSIETLAPAHWNEAAREVFFDDIVSDLQRYARDKGLRTIDPRIVPGAIQHRLSLMGLKPRDGSDPAPTKTPAAPTGTPATTGTRSPAATPSVTPQQLQQQSVRRAAAASAPPGAGSPVPSVPKAPAYDPSKPGTPIQQAAAFARSVVRSLSTRPS